MTVHRSFVCNSQKWKQLKHQSISEWLNKHCKHRTKQKIYISIMEYYITIKKEWAIDTYNLNKSPRNYAECKKAISKSHMLYGSIY